jgi:hypothetical protein
LAPSCFSSDTVTTCAFLLLRSSPYLRQVGKQGSSREGFVEQQVSGRSSYTGQAARHGQPVNCLYQSV